MNKQTETPNDQVLRFANPFFAPALLSTPFEMLAESNGLLQYIATTLQPIPATQRNPIMQLSEVIGNAGTAAIQAEGSIHLHAVGDTWNAHDAMQLAVADAMTADYNVAAPQKSPAFFLHLGDVNYYNNTDTGYHEQFFVPYKNYPGKIIAIPGNHDGELFKYDGTTTGQSVTLQAFWRNFCQPRAGVPPAAGSIYREMASQPGAYWLLDAPFVQIIGLYSNIAENPGFISDHAIVGQQQKDWLIQTLMTIQKSRANGQRKALLFATHHPPYSNGGHGSSNSMLADIDDACNKGGVMPDAFLSGHSHNYQRYTRYATFNNKQLQIPFVVAGTGGRGLNPVLPATVKRVGDNSFDKSLAAYGYLTITCTSQLLTISFFEVGATKQLFDTVTVQLAAHNT